MRDVLGPARRSRDQRATLAERAHRPWELRDRRWLMAQTWERLLFAHWRVDPAELRRVVPEPLPIDTFDGAAWVGVTPFVVRSLRLRGTLPMPVGSTFCELNVRTYATVDGKPGIYFLSLDAASRLAVAAARRAYRLPYFHAEMHAAFDEGRTRYRSRRLSPEGEPTSFEGTYEPTGRVAPAPPGTLEHFLAERYCLYVVDAERRVLRADIHHPPWPLQDAAAEIAINTMTAPHRLRLSGQPLFHYARRQDVLIWPLQPPEG